MNSWVADVMPRAANQAKKRPAAGRRAARADDDRRRSTTRDAGGGAPPAALALCSGRKLLLIHPNERSSRNDKLIKEAQVVWIKYTRSRVERYTHDT
jgi:hypothetical protein